MKITFKLYASLAGHLPSGAVNNAVQIEVDEDISLLQLIERYKVAPESAHLVLVNGIYSAPESRPQQSVLKAGDTVAIWPPVAGG